MIGYLLEQELGNLLPFEDPLATILTMVEVDPDDPAFADPTKFVGPIYDEATAKALAADKGWVVKPDGPNWRRVVPSPRPQRIFEIRPMRWLLEHGAVVICAGGGGIPTMYARGESATSSGSRRSSTRTSPAACSPASSTPTCSSWPPTSMASTPTGARPSRRASTGRRRTSSEAMDLPAGSMGPKVDAAVEFASATGKRSPSGRSRTSTAWSPAAAGTKVV